MFDADPCAAPRALQQSGEYARALHAMGVCLTWHDGVLVLQRHTFPGRLRLISGAAVMAPPPGRGGLVLNVAAPASRQLRDLGYLPLLSPAMQAVLTIAVTAAAQRAGHHQKWRNRLNRATALCAGSIRQSVLPPDPRHWLLRAEVAAQRARRYRALPVQFAAAYTAANPGAAQLFELYRQGTPVAGMLILRHGQQASYHIGQTTRRGRAVHGHNLLLAAAMDWCREAGLSHLDLGPLNTEDAPDLARFKLGTGAAALPRGGTWFWHRRLAPLARRLPLPRWPVPDVKTAKARGAGASA